MGLNYFVIRTTWYEKIIIHIGKKPAGWPFWWNFHFDKKEKYYHNKETLQAFLKQCTIIDDNDRILTYDEFHSIAFEYVSPVTPKEYFIKDGVICGETDIIIDGLRVSDWSRFS